eukprot:56794-Eustigmatos_ZCMA.PRE.4
MRRCSIVHHAWPQSEKHGLPVLQVYVLGVADQAHAGEGQRLHVRFIAFDTTLAPSLLLWCVVHPYIPLLVFCIC